MSFKISKEETNRFKALLHTAAEDLPSRKAIASIYSASLSQVHDPLNMANEIFTEVTRYSGNQVPEIPVDLFFGIGEGALRVWANGYPGGLQYNEITGADTFRFRTYRMDSAIAFAKAFAEDSRLDVLNKGMTRLMDEVLLKSQGNAFLTLAEALGNARTGGLGHVIPSFAKQSGAGHKLQIEDFNRLKVLMKRLNTSFAFGSTRSKQSNLTDLFMSPEMVADIRRMSYNPMNTTAVPDTQESTALGLPDTVRTNIFNGGGETTIWDVTIHEMSELGVGAPYNRLFQTYYTTAGAANAPTWVSATDEIIIGVDRAGSFSRVIQEDGEGNTFQLKVDDQFTAREEKVGWYGYTREGWVVGDARSVVGLLV